MLTWPEFFFCVIACLSRQARKFADALGVGRWYLLAGATSLRYMSFNVATTPAARGPNVGGWDDGMIGLGCWDAGMEKKHVICAFDFGQD